MSHAVFAINLLACVSSFVMMAILIIRIQLPRGSAAIAYSYLYCTFIALSLASIISLYIEANLPQAIFSIRRIYFLLVIGIVAALMHAIMLLYTRVFRLSHRAYSLARLVPLAVGVMMIAVLATQHHPTQFQKIVSSYFLVNAGVALIGVLFISLSYRYHLKNLHSVKHARYFKAALFLAWLLLCSYVGRIALEFSDAKSDFFNRVHYAFFLLVQNAFIAVLIFRPHPDTVTTFDAAVIGHYGLTEREVEIIRAVMAGHSNREIGRKLDVTEGTVKVFLYNIFRKTGVRSRMALAHLARTWL